MATGPIDVALRVVDILDDLGIPYVLGGSLASSIVGEPRATADVDLAIRIFETDVRPLVQALQGEFYIDEGAVRDAVRRGASFNLVHLATIYKVDLFVLGDGILDRSQLAHRQRIAVGDDPSRQLWIGSPEDQILRKLFWYRAGGEVSERQWRDVLAIFRVQGRRLDRAMMQSVAAEAGLTDLLQRVFAEAGAEE